MNEERIRQDEQLAKITIRGLTSYKRVVKTLYEVDFT